MKELYNLWFSSLDLKNNIKLDLLNQYNTEEIWYLSLENLVESGLSKEDANRIVKSKSLEEGKRDFEYMQEKHIKLISVKDENYPKKLREIENRPAFLYVRGQESILNEKAVGVVGCRMASEMGKNIARMLSKELANRNIHIVSGLAVGIDKSAHLGALDSDIGKTVAVLGGSLADEKIYPYENYKVFERILEKGGAIVSEYGIHSKPEASHFPERNRVISGLSDKVIVVEAKKRSGSLITASWALEQGKDVFAVPRKYFFEKFGWDQ